jgi:hypothetical protein
MSSRPRDDRISARLGPVRFEFEHPQVSRQSTARKVRHEVLPTGPEDDGETIIQSLGTEAAELTLRADVYRDEAKELDRVEGTVVALRHPRKSGDVFIDSVSTDPQGVEDDRDPTGRRYTARIELTEVR